MKTSLRFNAVFINVFLIVFTVFQSISILTYGEDTISYDLPMKKAVDLAINNNPLLKIAALKIEQATTKKMTAWSFDPVEIGFHSGQLYTTETGKYLEINQDFGSILTHIRLSQKANLEHDYTTLNYELSKNEISCEVKSAYSFWQFMYTKLNLLEKEKTLYERMRHFIELRYRSGDISLMQKSTAESKIVSIDQDYLSTFDDLTIATNKLKQLICSDSNYKPSPTQPEMYRIVKPSDTSSYRGKTYLAVLTKKYKLARADEKIAASDYFPGISGGFFHQDIGNMHNLNGWQIGISVPIDIPQQNAVEKNAKLQSEIAALELDYNIKQLHTTINDLLFDLNKSFRQIRYYEESALANADIILTTARAQLNSEEIDYEKFMESVSAAINIKINYYKTINTYNQKAFQLELYAN